MRSPWLQLERRGRRVGGVQAIVVLRLTAALLLWAVAAGAAGLQGVLDSDPLYPDAARRFARQFPRQHLKRQPLDDALAAAAWTNYLSALDDERVYFIESDIARFRARQRDIEDELADGNLAFPRLVAETLEDRVSNRCAFLAAMLSQPMDVTTPDVYHWKREDAPWAADEAAWDELWRKKIRNEYVRLVAAKQLAQSDATNAPPAPEALSPRDPLPPLLSESPAESIRSRYEEYLGVLRDSGMEWYLERYLTAFAQAYDPHSEYMSPSTIEDFNIEMQLSLVGIGALLRSANGAAEVVRLLPGGPAERDTREKRLRPGDRIIAVAQGTEPPVSILHWPLYRVVRLIRGERGSVVRLTAIPASDPAGVQVKIVDLTRDEVRLEEQAARLAVREHRDGTGATRNLGVITLPGFYADMELTDSDDAGPSAAADVARLLEAATTSGVDGVVLDMRDNGGGSLMEAVRLTGLFIASGPTVQVRETLGVRKLYDRDPSVAYAGPLVVLVNPLSASASEIVAAALQDYGRAVIVGSPSTHGKGTVQSILPLSRDSRMGAIKVTSSMFFRISGGSTQLRGVQADVVVPSPLDAIPMGEARLLNPMPWSAVKPATYVPVTDLTPLIPELRMRSAARRAADPRFAAQSELLEHLRQITQADDIPLDLDRRLRLAASERDLDDVEERVAAGRGGEEGGQDADDLIIEEALNVLSDLISIGEKTGTATVQPLTPAPQACDKAVSDWLRSFNL